MISGPAVIAGCGFTDLAHYSGDGNFTNVYLKRGRRSMPDGGRCAACGARAVTKKGSIRGSFRARPLAAVFVRVIVIEALGRLIDYDYRFAEHRFAKHERKLMGMLVIGGRAAAGAASDARVDKSQVN
jgi:hypothetical protein